MSFMNMYGKLFLYLGQTYRCIDVQRTGEGSPLAWDSAEQREARAVSTRYYSSMYVTHLNGLECIQLISRAAMTLLRKLNMSSRPVLTNARAQTLSTRQI